MNIRTTQPSNDNKCYLKTTVGGYNKCILGNANNKNTARPTKGSCLPNCVGYVYGRFLEYWNLKSCNLPTCNAKNWDDAAKEKNDDINYSKTPSVGSIIVFEGTTYGHVAFVERIESNGDLYLSESNWNGKIFRNVTVLKASGYAYSKTLKCVGFVTYAKAPKEEKPKYTTGNYIVTADVLRVRKGAGIKYEYLTFGKLSKDAQKKILTLKGQFTDGYVKGLKCSVSKVEEKDGYHWGKTPSGWIALEFCEALK